MLKKLSSNDKMQFKWTQQTKSTKHTLKGINGINTEKEHLEGGNVRAGNLEAGENAAAGVMVKKEGFIRSLFTNDSD